MKNINVILTIHILYINLHEKTKYAQDIEFTSNKPKQEDQSGFL